MIGPQQCTQRPKTGFTQLQKNNWRRHANGRSYTPSEIPKDSQRNSFVTGFTLIELLVVIGIIGALATLMFIQFGEVRTRGRDTKRISDVNSIWKAANICFDLNGAWPATIVVMVNPVPPNARCLTRDPKQPDGSDYGYVVNGNSVQVWAELEKKHSALDHDTDLIFSGSQNGTLESCNSPSATDCVFDFGQP